MREREREGGSYEEERKERERIREEGEKKKEKRVEDTKTSNPSQFCKVTSQIFIISLCIFQFKKGLNALELSDILYPS